MAATDRYASARNLFRNLGVDTDAALETLDKFPISMHCWQGDDVIGFDREGSLSGGTQTTPAAPGRRRNSCPTSRRRFP